MDAADDPDEDELLHYDVQMSIQESCQKECLVGSGRSEALKLVEAIKQGDVLDLQKLCHFPAAFSQVDEHGWYPLHRAAVQPLVQVLEMVLYASFSLTLEEKTSEGDTFLTLAVKAGLVENVKMLLDHKASPHQTNGKNESPLLLAVRAGSHQMVSILIAGGAQVEQVGLKVWTAVHEASRVGCVPVMELLLQNGGQVSRRDHHGVTPLGIAAEYSHPEILKLLIEHNADVNAQAPNGDSIMYDAAGSGNADCINILLQHGAIPNTRNLSSQLPLHHAAFEGHDQALRILIPLTTRRALRLCGSSPVHSAADGGHIHCLELLLQQGYDINAQLATHISDNYGDMRRSALYFAVSNGDATCTEMLLKSGAKTDLDPLRCLLVAVRSGSYEIVKLLLAAKVDVNCYFTVLTDTVFPTALQYCLKDEVMMRLLLNNGYKVERCFQCHHDNAFDEANEGDRKIPFCEFMSLCCVMHLSGSVVRTLLDYVNHVHICSKLRLLLEKQREWPEICDILTSPRSLRHLCRLDIRRRLTLKKLNNPEIMNSHLFPPRLKSFLLYRELDLYSQDPERTM